MKVNVWSAGVSRADNGKVYLTQRPMVRDFLYGVFDEVDAKSGHFFCGSHGWTHKIPLGFKREEFAGDKFWEKSLGLWLYSRYSDVTHWLTSKDEEVLVLPLTLEELQTVAPELAELLEDDE